MVLVVRVVLVAPVDNLTGQEEEEEDTMEMEPNIPPCMAAAVMVLVESHL